MSHELNCLSCAFFKAASVANPDRGGACRRYPPTPIFMGWREDAILKQPSPIWQNANPFVSKGDLCGEHPFMAGMRGGKIPLLGAASELRNLPGVQQGNGSTPPPATESAPLTDGTDAEVVHGEQGKA